MMFRMRRIVLWDCISQTTGFGRIWGLRAVDGETNCSTHGPAAHK